LEQNYLGDGSTSHLSRHREIREADIGDEPESSSGVWSKSFKKTFLRAGSVKMSEGLSDIDPEVLMGSGTSKTLRKIRPGIKDGDGNMRKMLRLLVISSDF
jgi:hypothetical protein